MKKVMAGTWATDPSNPFAGWPTGYDPLHPNFTPTTTSPGSSYQWNPNFNKWLAPGDVGYYGDSPSSTPSSTPTSTTPTTTPSGANYTKPANWTDAQWQSWQRVAQGGGDLRLNPPGSTPSTTPTTTPSTTPTTPTTTPPTTPTDPFTSWLGQQNVFPYTQSTLGMSGWNPASGYSPAAAGYNPSAMPNYTMDMYP